MNLDEWLIERLAEVDAAHLRRTLRTVDSAQGVEIVSGARTLLNFSSNDYLGLANDARLKEAAAAAVEEFGAGSGSARLICGNLAPHAELEAALAEFKGTEAALAFATGHAAALGTIPALVGKGDVVILDKLSHACLVDAARLSGAAIRVFPHNHLEKLRRLLEWARAAHPGGRVLVVTESVFSMDGDVAPLREIVELKERFGAWLFLDEAHAVGVIGPNGRGLAAELGVADRIDVQMGTLGKALGAVGGAICGSRALVEFLINRARSFIFSTAPAPAAAASATAAVRLLGSGALESLRAALKENIGTLARILGAEESPSAILPVILGDEARATAVAEALRDRGIAVGAVRYPTVARGSARLRITASAAHRQEHLESLAGAWSDLMSRATERAP